MGVGAAGVLRNERRGRSAWALLGLGLLAASVSAILIRYASEASPLAIAFWRCALGGAALVPFARSELGAARRKDVLLAAGAGAFLALHFAAWIASVGLTTIAASVLLVSTAPVFVALVSAAAFHERLAFPVWIGIGVALSGVGLVVAGGAEDGENATLLGNSLALSGGAAAAGYLLVGQRARRRLGTTAYAALAYGLAGALLLGVCLPGGVALSGYSARTWLAIAGIVLGPQLVGHTIINFLLRDLGATTVSVWLLAEPLVATALAFLLFSELPSLLVLPGGAAILAGIYLVSARRHRRPAVAD